MVVSRGGHNVNVQGKELKLFTFNGNYNPIYDVDEAELTTIKMPAIDEKQAWDRLSWLLGSMHKIEHFRIDDVEDYE